MDKKEKSDLRDGDKIYDLVDVIEEKLSGVAPAMGRTGQRDEVIVREIRDITERIARELIPGIVERVIREEIEKLKKAGD